ncbi:unnamed protein product [Paramecium octaurelia]|uniref:WD domain, G-beta repeat protein n=1 Tax=Paramecium octaurelia TaxID=43137 RepID=A0A8S1X0K2_PAROT|nr:unnamed protein product [Paramecium octaurelia]
MCSRHPNQALSHVLINHKQQGLCCQQCIYQDSLPQQLVVPLQQFLTLVRSEINNKINDIHEEKKISTQYEKLHMEVLKNIQQAFKQIQNFIFQQSYQQMKLNEDVYQAQTLIDQIEQRQITNRQAQDNVILLLEKSIDYNGKKFELKNYSGKQFKDQLNQVMLCYNQLQVMQSILQLQNNVEQIFKRYSQQKEFSNYNQSNNNSQITQQTTPSQKFKYEYTNAQQNQQYVPQQLSQTTQLSNTNQSTQNKQNEYTRQNTQSKNATQSSRSHSIETKQVQYLDQSQNYQTDRSLTPQSMKTDQSNKPYQFQSGLLFGEQLKRTISDKQQEQIRQQQNTSSSLISRSNLFPKTEKQYSIKVHEKRISQLQVGQLCIFTSSYDKLIRAWDKSNGKMIATLEGHTREIVNIKFKFETLASCGQDKVIRIWKHHPRWQLIGNLKGHQGTITCLDFLNPKQLISGSEDQSIKIWDLDKMLEIHYLKFDFGIYSLAIYNEKFYVGGDGILIVHQCPQLQQTNFIQLHESPILIILQTKLYIITIDKEGIIKLLNQQSYQVIKELRDDYEISSALYIQQFNFLVIGLSTKNGEGKICFWSLDTFRKIKEIYDNGSGVGGLAWESPYLWSGHDNKRLESIKFLQQQ